MSTVTDTGRLYRLVLDGAPVHVIERDGEWRRVDGDIFGEWRPGAVVDPAGARRLAPVEPSKIVAVGLNYRDHADETGKPVPSEPMIFLKPPTAVVGPGAPIRVPPGIGRVDPEAEVGVVIGRRAWRVPEARARDYVLGLIGVNDVTARDLQARDVQFTRAKGFDTFAPLGPCVALGFDGRPVRVEGRVNGERRQASDTSRLIFSIERLVAFVSSVMTLLPGDVIATGTPSGIAPIRPGDVVTVWVEGVGELTNPVEALQFEEGV
ncbi:MAG TPA: fumarylacetoacetate hydrolase family protein [Vicinamibacterales bacterium]|nr:fumarylacetoacetate hydrolase family protein [Vicinamibacterales bacterium]